MQQMFLKAHPIQRRSYFDRYRCRHNPLHIDKRVTAVGSLTDGSVTVRTRNKYLLTVVAMYLCALRTRRFQMVRNSRSCALRKTKRSGNKFCELLCEIEERVNISFSEMG